jgi:type III secretion system YscQ/HrcQ family protein
VTARVRSFPFADLPQLARRQAEVGRTLLAHLPGAGPDWPDVCRALGGPVEIELVEAFPAPARELGSHARGVRVVVATAGGRRALVALDPKLAPRLCRRALGLVEDELPAPRPLTLAEQGALEFLVGSLVDGASARLEMVLAPDEPSPPLGEGDIWVLTARLATPVGGGWARLVCSESVRLQPLPARDPDELRRGGARLDAIRASLRLELPPVRMTPSDLAQLGNRDVVLLGRRRDAMVAFLRLGRGGFQVRLDGELCTIDGGPFLGSRMETKKPEDAAAAELLRELPVEVVCELGRVEMSGRELIELRPGVVLPVGRPLAGPVDLTVGGRVVARGELVDVEGEIGVRVTTIAD